MCLIVVTSYTAHDPKQQGSISQFTCGFADDFTLENMILHGTHDGMAADTSWRNKSENQAAVTFLITVDENNHLVPGKSTQMDFHGVTTH